MKKIMIAVAIVCTTAFANAAAIGWSIGGLTSDYANDKYMEFVIGQNDVTSVAQITALLDAGTDVSTYAFGDGSVAANGSASVLAANSGKTLDAGTYTSFAVLFDSAAPKAGEAKYVALEGATGQTITFAATATSKTLAAGNVASVVGNAENWKAFGAVPEPTSGLLLLLGVAGLALKRRRA